MKKIRAAAKTLLVDTYFFDLAKHLYTRIKLRVDKKRFLKTHPNASYIVYGPDEILSQREKGFQSQFGQDHYLYSRYLSTKNTGVFVDVGANRAVVNSNSFFLETRGWTGVAIDPMRRFQSEWHELRKTPLIEGAVSSSESDEAFIEILPKVGWEHALSGFKKHVRKEDLALYEHVEYQVKAKPLSHYYSQPEEVDVLFVDVEGAELQVLQGIDFSKFSPPLILIENDGMFGGDEKIREFLNTFGYRCVARIGATDDLYEKVSD